jgi:N-acyl-D-amino-acid deacylase
VNLRAPLGIATAAILLIGAAPNPPLQTTVITGGTIFDGSLRQPTVGDVVIQGDRIVAVGLNVGKRYRNAKHIDARGMVVAPGFIDPHTHSDAFIRSSDPAERIVAPWLAQGVTTIVTGVDGYGQGSGTVGGLFDHIQQNGVGPNVATFVGFGAVRTKVLNNDNRAPSETELETMKKLTASGMCEGALGLSTGLFYAPQSFAYTSEVIAVASEAAQRGGVYDTHQRDESNYTIGVVKSVEEGIAIGRGAGLPVHFAHLKALGAEVHGKAGEIISTIEAARSGGLLVTADQYPYEASGSSLVASLVPRWAQDGGPTALLTRILATDTRARIVGDMVLNLARRGGANAVLLRGTGQPWTGKRLDAVASDWGVDPIEAALRIIVHDEGKGSPIVSFNMNEADIKLLMRQPWMMTGSDGSAGHPRMYGTYPTKYATYVLKEKTIDLLTFINSSSGRVADFYKFDRRGYIKPDYFADIVMFDAATYRPRATYDDPNKLAVGISLVMVNGALAINDGTITGLRAGRGLKHHPTPGSCSPSTRR